LESTNFSLNDEEFRKIKEISDKVDSEILILFWQFTLRTIEELEIVSNQNLSIEMFLMRLMYLSSSKSNKENLEKKDRPKSFENDLINNLKTEPINQIKNISQEKKVKSELQKDVKAQEKIAINSFDDLILICSKKKEMKLKYELEKNVNLVSFEKNRIEISFNDNLDKNFVKDLSLKLFEWTDQRWIITFSKTKGEISIKEKEINKKISSIEKAKNTNLYKSVLEKFPDANLIDVISKEKTED
ncbi:DNA polymerase III, subunit gamma and tau, partial [Candidatus Pelagibacter sp.]|nr:DNA polymerase III, subunit gamma and tau [Candidatus Pelagibacter sp.]